LHDNFTPCAATKAMVYFEDGDLHTLTKNERSTLIKAVAEVRHLPEVAILNRQLVAQIF
jgi:hypothetical protein